MNNNSNLTVPDAALIYCRVSSKKQEDEGSGLDSQEHRCREKAEQLGCDVEAIFPDTISGGGDFLKRPGMVRLLAHLDSNPHKRYVVIFDDLKRYSRDTEFHLALRREMMKRNAIRICLNFNFEDTPEGKFLETILAATGTLEREQNARQVTQKMRARMEQGFWVNRAPVGYRYEKSARGGKELVFNEPLASIVKEALEGFAAGRFETQAEVQRFLEGQPEYPKDMAGGKIRPMTVARLLKKPIYAGYIESKAWNV
jgi:DNA invertase Pin-like site-specific DNA recombinase